MTIHDLVDLDDLPYNIKDNVVKIQKCVAIIYSDSQSLAAQIVIYKMLGLNKQYALLCMEELFRRRELGEDFDYEEYIEEKLAKSKTDLPKPVDLKTIVNISKMLAVKQA